MASEEELIENDESLIALTTHFAQVSYGNAGMEYVAS